MNKFVSKITSSKETKPAREKLRKAGTLHWFHWLIVLLSVFVTLFAWDYSRSQQRERIKSQFDREADQVAALILERMEKYEDALWSGVAMIQTHGGDVEVDQWQEYASRLNLVKKCPGINGIGVIHSVSNENIEQYLDKQRRLRPDFQIHHFHAGVEHYPISFITPDYGNEASIGLDVAYEINRITAANKSRDTGAAQITAPITLIQDTGQTAGFLFFAPFYHNETTDSVEERKTHFAGMVYAPFIVKRLMAGLLQKELRHVGIRLRDGDQVVYDEHVPEEIDFDAAPLFERSIDLEMYGRVWTFDIWSANSFRLAATDNQPLTILVGGILIDSLLMLMFISISRASKQALEYADSMTVDLANSNRDLEQFAYVASHDLQEPLRKVSSYGELLREECGQELSEAGNDYLDVMIRSTNRLKTLVRDLLAFSRIPTKREDLTSIDSSQCLKTAIQDLEVVIDECGATVTFDSLPTVIADRGQLTTLFQNLVSNAIKYRGADPPVIHVGGKGRGEWFEFCVQDNGIGIESKFFERIFEIFQRLHNRNQYSGTGIGLALCKRIVDRFGGEIRVESCVGKGSKFYFTVRQSKSVSSSNHFVPLTFLTAPVKHESMCT